MSHRVLISVINWNNASKTIACLESLYQLDYEDYDVLIIDNDSHDESVATIRRAFPQQTIHIADENLGFAAGHELAISYLIDGNYDYLWILNNDSLVTPDSLKKLMDVVTQIGENALYSSVPYRSRDDDTIAFTAKYLMSDTFPRNTTKKFPPVSSKNFFGREAIRKVSALPGSCMLVPKAIIEKYGFMSHDYFLYGEEIDFCLRMKKQGVDCYMVADSKIYHEGEGSTNRTPELSAVVAYYRTRGLIIKSMRHDTVFMTSLAFFFQTRLALTLALRGLRHNTIDRLKARMVMQGVIDAAIQRSGKTIAPEDYILEQD